MFVPLGLSFNFICNTFSDNKRNNSPTTRAIDDKQTQTTHRTRTASTYSMH